MEEAKSKIPVGDETQKSRRAVIKTAAQVAVTAPAVMVLLSAETKPASATVVYRAALLSADGKVTENTFDGNIDDTVD